MRQTITKVYDNMELDEFIELLKNLTNDQVSIVEIQIHPRYLIDNGKRVFMIKTREIIYGENQ